jgi:hypothetical protein
MGETSPVIDVIGKAPRRSRLSPLFRRGLGLAGLLVGGIVIYASILTGFDLTTKVGEIELGATTSQARVGLYLQPIHVDPVNESIQTRISVIPISSTASTIADHDFVLTIGRGTQVERVQIISGNPLPEITYEFDLHDGDVRNYPLDKYASLITLMAIERAPDSKEHALPIHVTVWEAAPGFNVKATASQQGDELRIQYAVSRLGAVSFFGLAMYIAMLVMMTCALIIGSLVFLGVRKIEATLVSALGAIIFALPALRNAMPGAPPLGVRADILVFFWAELGAVMGLCLFITAWAREGAQP